MEEKSKDSNKKWLKLSRKWPDRSDKWAHYGAGSRRICPSEGLPIWKDLPLDKKLPFIATPPGATFFSRGWPGEQLWPREKANDFRLHDAHGHVLHLPYESLHDPHLIRHLRKDTVAECLRRKEHLNPEGTVRCDLKDLNTFREVTRVMNLDHVHHGMRAEVEENEERKRLQQIEEHLNKKKDEWDLQQKLKEAGAERAHNRAQKNVERKEKWLRKQQYANTRLQMLTAKRKTEQEDRKLESQIKSDKLKEKLEGLAVSRKLKQLGHVRKMRRRDVRLRIQKLREQQQREQNNLDEIKRLWTQKVAEMQKSEALDQTILADVMDERRANVERRKEETEKAKQRQDDFKEEQRLKRSKSRAVLQAKLQKSQIRKSILATWLPDHTTQIDPNVEYIVRKSINSAFSGRGESSAGVDNYLALLMCKEKYEKLKEIPTPVSYVIEYMLEKSIKIWMEKTLTPMIAEAKKTVLKYGDETLQKLKASHTKKPQRLLDLEKLEMIEKIVSRPKERKVVTYRNSLDQKARSSFMADYLENNEEDSDSKPRSGQKTGTVRIIPRIAFNLETEEAIPKNSEPEKKSTPTRTSLSFPDSLKSTPVAETCVLRMEEGRDIERPSMFRLSRKKTTSSVRFGTLEEIRVLEFPDQVKSVRNRKMSPMPSFENLARAALTDSPLSPQASKEDLTFPEKAELESICRTRVKRLVSQARTIMERCVTPTTRLRTINKLVPIQEYNTEELVSNLARDLMENQQEKKPKPKERYVSAAEDLAAGVAKYAVTKLLSPPEFRKKENDYVTRYRIMFTNPKNIK